MARIMVPAYSAQSSRPSKRWGQVAQLPLQSNAATGHLRATLSADIPENAVVTKAELVLSVAAPWTGSKTTTVRRHSAAWSSTITWATRPGVSGTAVAVAATDPAVRKTLVFNVLPDVQEFIAGTVPNYGWQVYTNSAVTVLLNGSTAARGAPYLDLEWVLPGEPPTDLSPDGTVATGTPTLTFVAPDDTTHVQVQIDNTDDFASPEYDSGQVAATGNLFKTSTTAWTIANLTTRYWRVRAWAGGVASEWSAPARLYRKNLPGITILTPGATTGDPAPEVTWTFTDQVAWQATLYDHERGRLVADSGRTAGTATAWTPPEGLLGEGQGTYTVRAWDSDYERVPTPGVPAYVEATKTFLVNVGGSDAGPTDLTVTQRAGTPIVDLAWSFATPPAGGVQITRSVNGEPAQFLKRITNTGTTQWADRTAPRYANVVYRVLAVNASGTVSNVGPSELVYLRGMGVWLLDPDAAYADTAAVCFLGQGQGTQVMPEQAVLHTVNGRQAVRRRLGLVPPSGTVSGTIMTALGVSAAQGLSTLMDFKAADAGKVYRLVLGTWNMPVTIGDVAAFPTPNSRDDAEYTADFSWWHTDEELPW